MDFFHKFDSIELNEDRFVGLLDKMVSSGKYLQNNPSQGLIPIEDKASQYVLEALSPYTTENGGPIEVNRISFVEGRGNVIIHYPGTEKNRTCSFVGSHLDVVPADPNEWERDPFKFSREGDNLYGRGTTDCLGHVALLTDLFITLAEHKAVLKTSIYAVFIANEENSLYVGIGIDQLCIEGYLDALKSGPLFWVDSADSMPCIGTAGAIQWQLKATGKLFHSGLLHKGINAIELGMDAIKYMQKRFYADFPKHPREVEYNFVTSSSFKPTQISCTPGALNQLPPLCTIEGDIRIAPFYDFASVKEKLESYVAELNADITLLESEEYHGPNSKYTLPSEGLKGALALKWLTGGENGVACALDSKGYHAIMRATKEVLGEAKPYSIGGSLPLIRDLQDNGFDVQITGYGLSSKYHANNESASLEGYKRAAKIMAKVISYMEE